MTNRRPALEDEFEKLAKIGQGSYGVVYKVKRKASQDIVALKRVKLNCNLTGAEEGIPSSSLREIAALKNLKHPNVLELLEIIHTGTSLYLVFEFLDLDLKRALDQTQYGLPPKQVKNFMWQLLKGIAHCHSRRILHRDLKLQNLLINKATNTVKLADFGLARNMSLPLRVYTKEVVTLWYRAPEILLGSELYGPAIDLWSLGCIFFEMLTKKVLIPGDSAIDQLFKAFQVLGTPTESQWPKISSLPYYKANFPKWPSKNMRELLTSSVANHKDDTSSSIHQDLVMAADLISKMLIYDPFQRITAQDAMKHSYFDEMTKRPMLRNIQDIQIVSKRSKNT